MNQLQFDCGTKGMCPICKSNNFNPGSACTGVIGAADDSQWPEGNVPIQNPSDPSWSGGNTNLNDAVLALDKKACTKNGAGAKFDGTIGLYNNPGFCISGTNNRVLQKNPLIIDADLISSVQKDDMTSFPLQTLHKTWGDQAALMTQKGNKFTNYGVNSRNVYVGEPQNVSYTLNGENQHLSQKVIVMEAHGDNYTGEIPGLKRISQNSSSLDRASLDRASPKPGTKALPICPTYEQTAQGQRVGGIACTRNNYGPGVYNTLLYIPKTEWKAMQGRGYVFALWTFHYSEHYKQTPNNAPKNPPQLFQTADGKLMPCANECDINCHDPDFFGSPFCQAPPPCPGKDCSDTGGNNNCSCGKEMGNDLFAVQNHEIDIEIPANSSQLNWEKELTLDTMNCNTWWNDIANYDQNTGALYTQVAVKKKGGGTFFSDSAEDDHDKEYHWITIDWRLKGATNGGKEPSNMPKNGYVCFYYDDPFDPTGQATGPKNEKLPLGPKSDPLFCTTRFVPTRCSRLNVGPWFGWWGYGRTADKPNASPEFDTAKVRLAHLTISPYHDTDGNPQGVNLPQSFDQPGASCDFRDMYSQGDPPHDVPVTPTPPYTPNGPIPPPDTVSHTWLWILLGILLFIILVGVGAYLYHKKHKKKIV